MSSLDEARGHLAKAREFFEAAQLSHERELFNAATSDAVLAGINSKDAICLRLVGRTEKSDNHHQATAELKAAGPPGAASASTLGRLLKLKTKSQYLSVSPSVSLSRSDSARAIEWAARMLAEAERVVSTR